MRGHAGSQLFPKMSYWKYIKENTRRKKSSNPYVYFDFSFNFRQYENMLFTVLSPSIFPCPFNPIQGHRGAGAYPSCLWADRWGIL